jgi:hypothetical protein
METHRSAGEAEALNDQLSSAKDKKLNRADIQLVFHKGLLFLASLLGSIDESKLRPTLDANKE